MRTVGCASASPTSRAACPGADTTLQDFAGASCTSSYASLPASQASGETARGGDRDRLEQTPPRCHPLDLGVVLSSPPGSVRSAKAPSSAGRSSIVLGLHPAPSAADLCGSASARSLRSEHSRSPGPDVSGGVKRALFQAASRSGLGRADSAPAARRRGVQASEPPRAGCPRAARAQASAAPAAAGAPAWAAAGAAAWEEHQAGTASAWARRPRTGSSIAVPARPATLTRGSAQRCSSRWRRRPGRPRRARLRPSALLAAGRHLLRRRPFRRRPSR